MPSKRAALTLDSDALVEPILAARDAHTFVDAVRDGYMALYERMMGARGLQRQGLDELDDALARLTGRRRAQRALALCAWPLLDKPGVNAPAGEPPQFLWLFAVPFVLTFEERALGQPVVFGEESFDAQGLLMALSDTGFVNDAAELGVLSNLFRREDLHAAGPRHIASEMLKAEEGTPHSLHPLPLVLDKTLAAGRAVTMFALCVARLPVTERQLFDRTRPWPAEVMAANMLEWLCGHGLPVESVHSFAPCSLAEVQFLCKGAGVAELRTMLELARTRHGNLPVRVRFPMEGVAELHGKLPSGAEQLLAAPMSFLEPPSEFAATVCAQCEALGLPFDGAYTLRSASSAALH